MPVTQSDSAAGEGEGRHDSQHYRTVNCKRRVKSCIHEKHHGWCSLYLSTGFVGSGQGRKSILSTYISILRLDPGRWVRFLYDLWFPWKRAHIRISLPPAATPYFFCIAGSAWMSCLTKKTHGHRVNEGSCIALCHLFLLCLECWTIQNNKSP